MPEALLARACMHTLAQAGVSNCSASELRSLLPVLRVASGEAKVRQALRSLPACFVQIRPGRWQVGVAPSLILRLVSDRSDLANS
jgi:hypothetical protein